MKPRERVLRAVNHEETDRVPLDFPDSSNGIVKRLISFTKTTDYEMLLRLLNIDMRLIGMLEYSGEKRYYCGEEADYWGITQKAYDDGDSSNQCPLRDVTSIDEVESYKWPSADDFHGEKIPGEIQRCGDYAITAEIWAPIYHNYTWMCGYENGLVYLHTQPEVAQAIIRHITDFWIGYARKYLEIGRGRIDIGISCNDFGAQRGLIMNPDMFRKFFKPELKRLFDVMKEYGAKAMLHSCGSIASIIPDIIEIGVDILDPIQVSAEGMNPEDLKSKFGKKITFHGGIDTQHLLREGTVEEVKHETSRIAKILSEGGGYILTGTQGFQDDIPAENIVAIYDARKGSYAL